MIKPLVNILRVFQVAPLSLFSFCVSHLSTSFSYVLFSNGGYLTFYGSFQSKAPPLTIFSFQGALNPGLFKYFQYFFFRLLSIQPFDLFSTSPEIFTMTDLVKYLGRSSNIIVLCIKNQSIEWLWHIQLQRPFYFLERVGETHDEILRCVS